MQSPCKTCKRVKDPYNCENKDYKFWRAWFLSEWDKIRARLLHK